MLCLNAKFPTSHATHSYLMVLMKQIIKLELSDMELNYVM